MEQQPFITISHLSHWYDRLLAVDDVSFNIHRGEILGFLGTNGAGKSTTMQMIAGTLATHKGQITIAGYDLMTQAKQAKRHIGFLPENPPLYPSLTVDEYLRYAACIRGVDKTKIAEAISVSKQRCGLESMGQRLINNLSKGYKQRVGIAQAIIHAPSVIILDEPTSGLDPIQITEIRALMRELCAKHSIILSTHILSEVESLCDRVLIIDKGKLLLDQNVNMLQEKSDSPNQIEIGLRTPPALETIEQTSGVCAVKKISNTVFQIDLSDGTNSVEKILQQSLDQHWGLYRLNAEADNLEKTFTRLIHREAGSDNAALENGIVNLTRLIHREAGSDNA